MKTCKTISCKKFSSFQEVCTNPYDKLSVSRNYHLYSQSVTGVSVLHWDFVVVPCTLSRQMANGNQPIITIGCWIGQGLFNIIGRVYQIATTMLSVVVILLHLHF